MRPDGAAVLNQKTGIPSDVVAISYAFADTFRNILTGFQVPQLSMMLVFQSFSIAMGSMQDSGSKVVIVYYHYVVYVEELIGGLQK